MKNKTDGASLRVIFGLKLKNYRQQKAMGLKELAEKSGMAISYLSEIEQGKKYPKPEKMMQLASALGVEYDEMVSLKVNQTLDPLTSLLRSELIKEFPFDLFGISARDILNLFSGAPAKATAFLQTFLEISQAYDMSVENFLFAALRTYQKLHFNYFPELEKEALLFAKNHGFDNQLVTYETLQNILINQYNYEIDEHKIVNYPALKDFRSVYKAGSIPKLFLNPLLKPSQKAFILARELGFIQLKLKTRPMTSSWLKVGSFDQLINNLKASYFAGAIILPQKMIVADLKHFAELDKWEGNLILSYLEKYKATPEMFLYRMSQLLPGVFKLKNLFYLRFTHESGQHEMNLTKELNMTDELVPYGLGLKEHYCRRWLPLKLLKAMDKSINKKTAYPIIDIQRARFIGSGNEFLLISLARPLATAVQKHSAMTIGFKLGIKEKRIIKFTDDPQIQVADVNETCERCPLTKTQCSDRVAEADLVYEKEKLAEREKSLADFISKN